MSTPNANATPAVAEKERGKITYQVAGQDVTLSYNIVRDYLTKGNGSVTDQDIVQFISICKFNQLNPFLNEAYLIKYGSQPAQMVVSKEALMKRADACESYEGIQSGIIVISGGQIEEREGCFYTSKEELVGGWAKVYRKDRKFPIVAKVNLAEYDKNQSIWIEKKSTMIAKIAKVQALREAFPAQLGTMYTSEEKGIQDINFIDVTEKVTKEKASNANKSVIGIDTGNAKPSETVAPMDVDTKTGEILEPAKTAPVTPGF